MTMLFVNTLKAPFITHMLGSATKNFADIVMSGEIIEIAVKSGKIDVGDNNRRQNSKKKEGEVNNVNTHSKSITVNQPRKVVAGQQGSSKQESGTRPSNERPQFTPIPMSYKELYQNLFNAHVVAPFYLTPLQPPYSKWYDANAQCDYHAGVTGHSIEHCTAFKKLVEKLIQMGVVKIDDSSGTENPLPKHTDARVNMVGEVTGKKVKKNIDEVRIPLRRVWKEMVRRGLIVSDVVESDETQNYCEFHHEVGHEIQVCEKFRALVQSMMDVGEIEFFEEEERKGSICVSELETRIPKIIISRPRVTEVKTQVTPKIVIQKPTKFLYKNSKKVPRNYECEITISGKEASISVAKENQKTGIRVNTEKYGSGINSQAESVEGKVFAAEQKEEKKAELSVVEQLHKQPARISVLALLKNSEVHRNALMKALNEAYVASDISVNQLDRLINNISADNFIFFNDDEIPSGGMGSTKALHITAWCKGSLVSGVLINNGSALNVLPLSTLNRLPVDSSHMKTCQNVVRAFDGTGRKVLGRIEILLLIGPNTYKVDFIVMDIKPSYNCLLGRPWIHSAGAVPSMLHQKLKLVTEGRLVTINAEESIIASVTSNAPYVETDEEAVECSFRTLEFINTTFIAEGNRIEIPKISKTTRIGLQLMVGRGAVPGKGLGRDLQGRVEAPVMKEKFDHFGLGYRQDIKQIRREIERRQERRKARLTGNEVSWEPMVFPHISKTFVSGGFIHPEQRVLEVEGVEEILGDIHINALDTVERETWLEISLYEHGSDLGQLIAEEIPVVFRACSESPDINDMSDAASDSESPFERDRCLEGSQNFEDDIDCDVSPDLLRMVEEEDQQISHHRESLEIVSLEEGKEVKIGIDISAKTRQDLIELLREFKDVFAWSYQDIPWLSTDIVVHRLPIKKDCKPASPKDNFPLPHIDTLVDNTAGYSLFSFMDGFYGYNQIKMHPKDMRKTTFITLWGTFCYKVMPFGLKNAGATYQRAMVTLFHDMMHKEIEVYVDDMIAKSRTEEEHVQVLRKLFFRLRNFQLKLNPTKCTFGARSGKLLGFIVSGKGIEVDPDKVRAIRDLPPPHTQKEVRGFLGRLNYISRFISQLTEKCDPLFRLLKKHNPGIWDEECQKAFDKLKQYLSNPPVLSPPNLDRPLILYLTVFDNSMGKLDFDCTNNMAEYEACIMGIRAAIERKIKVLEVYGDSALVIYQLKGEWETKGL
ncbi:uncharacterized protein LOC105786759 [Gossypium raimondii]|uniref:uncharacterized protein LOC105786759 n=1 Tax=Gossypium raimondii TaxID=29730 RepID=UPI00227D48B6|nr:uncharacterized protein LOC105786759 [Gossypium raimondii]